jgi:hypothetical protein
LNPIRGGAIAYRIYRMSNLRLSMVRTQWLKINTWQLFADIMIAMQQFGA